MSARGWRLAKWRVARACLGVAGLLGAAGLVLGGGCATDLPWGIGGPDLMTPEDAMPGALVRAYGPGALERASERLSLATRDALAAGIAWPDRTEFGTVWAAGWQGFQLHAGATALAIEAGRLVARVQVGVQAATLALGARDASAPPCQVAASIGPGTLTVPLGFSVDKLGRMTGQVLDGARWDGAIYLSDPDACAPVGADALGPVLAEVAPVGLAPILAPALAPALDLGLAFGGASAVGADPTGAGVLRVAVRGDATTPVSFAGTRAIFAWDVGAEAEAHPCMAPAALPPADVTPSAPPLLPDGTSAWRLGSVERILQAAWLAGGACGDHMSGAGEPGRRVTAGELAPIWGALGRLEPEAAVHVELWPTALPTLTASPEGALILTTGELELALWGEVDQASWRLATMRVSVVVTGSLLRDAHGAVTFDAQAVEVTPLETVGGLIGTPDLGVAAAIAEVLVEAIVQDRPVMTLPKVLAPATADTLMLVPSATGDAGDAWIVFPP